MLNKTKSYKFNVSLGKFVERTPEELAQLNQRKAEQAASEPHSARKRIPLSKEPYVKVHRSQLEKLFGLEPACTFVFLVLACENFRLRGPFVLPVAALQAVKGLHKTRLWVILGQLETCGLIRVVRNPPRSPVIVVL